MKDDKTGGVPFPDPAARPTEPAGYALSSGSAEAVQRRIETLRELERIDGALRRQRILLKMFFGVLGFGALLAALLIAWGPGANWIQRNIPELLQLLRPGVQSTAGSHQGDAARAVNEQNY